MSDTDGYSPIRWCVICGWSTDDPDERTCDCEDGVPMSMTGSH